MSAHAASSFDFWKSGAGCYDGCINLFFLYDSVFPAIAMYNSGAAIYQAQRNTRLPMLIAVFSNALNIAGNAADLGHAYGRCRCGNCHACIQNCIGSCRICISAQRRTGNLYSELCADQTDFHRIKTILALGIPNGIETSMFQFGKLAIQSTVSTLERQPWRHRP